MKKIYLVIGLVAAIICLTGIIAAAGPQDIMIVLDNSGSMHKSDPDIITKSIVSAFILQLQQVDRVGIVIFDESARLSASLTLLDNPAARKKLFGSLAQMDYRGQFTNTSAAIERAIYELRTTGRKDSQRSILFLTDGIVDTGNAHRDAEMTEWLTEDLTAECVDLGVKIFGIAFTEKADFYLIQSLAVKTKGAYFRASQVDDISKAFEEIIGLLTADADTISEAAEEPENMAGHQPDINTNVTSVKIQEKASDSIHTSFFKGLGRTIIVFAAISVLGLVLYLFLQRKKVRPIKLTPAEPEGGDDSLNFDPEAQLVGMSKTDMNDLEPDLLYLLDKRKVTIGRGPENEIVLSQSTVSNLHATIQYVNGYFQLKDNNSTNGTFLKNNRLAPNQSVLLKHGDIIKFATVDFCFLRTDNASAVETIMLTEKLKLKI